MSLPPAIHAVLRTYTMEDYRDIIGRPAGGFSLQEALSEHHKTLQLNEDIEKTAQYPRMRVMDLIPATTCLLTDAGTFVVLPPSELVNGEPLTPIHAREEKVHGFEPLVRIIHNEKLSRGHCFANKAFFDHFILGTSALAQIISHESFSTFSVVLFDEIDELDFPCIMASGSVFQNIRRVAVSLSLLSQLSICFRDAHFDIPLDWLSILETADGEVMSVQQLPPAKKICFCPAVDDFVLANVFGDNGVDIFSLIVEAAISTVLHGLMVSEGDILSLFMSPPNGKINTQESGVAALEAYLKCIKHKVDHWDGVFIHEQLTKNLNMLSVRVAVVETSFSSGVGVVNLKGETPLTELSIVSQSFSSCHPYLAPLYPPTKGHFCEVDFKQKVRTCFDECFHSKGGWRTNVFVAQGLSENMPCELIEDTAFEYGVLTLFASVEGLADTDARLLVEKFYEQQTPMVMVLKSAQRIATESPQLLSLFDVKPNTRRSCPKAVFLVCETIDAVPPSLSARAQNKGGVILCGNPSEEDRKRILEKTIGSLCAFHQVHRSLILSLDSLASWTTGLSLSDLLAFAGECVNDAKCVEPLPPTVSPVLSDIQCEDVLSRYLNSHGHNLVSTKLQPVRWSDVGGLEDAKRELQETIQLPILHPELFSNGLKRRAGILFYGPPGCGKTLLAKAVATEMNMNFMSVKGPELINQYVGESERNIRILFQKARDNSPCIIFFDELDALAPARGAKGDAGGAMDRIVSQLLVEVDGVGQKRSDGTEGGQVFIIGATNRPDLLDPSLLRPGRFDRLCYLGIPSTKAEQLYAVKALTRKFQMDSDVSLEELVAPLDFVYTGADFFALCSDAMMHAVDEILEKVNIPMPVAGNTEDIESSTEEELEPIKVRMRHFLLARDKLKASVTREDLARYESLKSKFSS